MNRGARGGPRGGRGGVRGRGGRGAGARGGAARGRGAGRRALPTPAPAAATADPASPKPQRQRALPTPTTATTSNDPVADELPDVPLASSDNQTTEEQQSSTPISPRRALPNPARNATAGRSAQRRGLPQPGRRGVGRNVSRSGGGRGAGRGAPSNNAAIPKRELPPRAQTPPSDDENNDSASEEIETTIIESKPAQPIQKIPSRGGAGGGGAARRLPIASRSRQLPVARGPIRSARGGVAGRGRGRGGLKQPDAGPAKALPNPNQYDESSNSHLNYAKLPRESSIKPKESKETEEEKEENNENNDDFEEDPFANEDDVFNAPPMHSPEPANDDIFDEMPDMAPPDIDEEFNLADLGDVEDIDAELARVEAELAKVQAGNDLDDLDDNMFDDMDQINQEEEEEKKRLQQEQELQKQEEAKRKRAEMQRKVAEEQRRAEIERKRQEQQRIAEEKRKAEEARRAAEAEAARIEEQRRLEEQRKLAAIPDTIEVEIEEEIETFEMREKKVPHPDMIDYDPSDTRKRSRAVAKYIGQEEGELNFEKGDLVIIEQQEDDGWWLGVNKNGDNGWFEFHYVELIEWPLPPVIKKERVKVMKTVKKTVSRPNPEKERLRRQLASAANKKLPATPGALRPAAPLPTTASRGRGVGRAPGRNRPPRAAPAVEEPAVDNISAIDEAIAEKASTSRLKTIRKPGARTGRRPPTRRKKVAIETKTQTEAPVVIEATKEDEAPLHHTGPQFGMGMMGSTRRGGSGVRAPRGSGIRAPRGRGRGAGRAARPPAPTPAADSGPPPFGGAGIGFDDDPFTASTGPKRPQPTPQPAARRGRGGGLGRAPSRRGGRGVAQTPSGRKMPVGAVNIFGGAGGFDPFAGKASADTSTAPVVDDEFDQYDNNNAVSTPASQPSSVTSSRRLSWDAKQSAGTQQREDQFNAPVSTTNMGDASSACLCPICGKAYLTPNDVVIHTQKRHADAGYKDINQESVTDEKPTAPSQSRSKAQRAKNMFAGVTQTLGRRNRSAW